MLMKHCGLSFQQAWDQVQRHPVAQPAKFRGRSDFLGFLQNLEAEPTQEHQRQQDVYWAIV